MASTAKTKSPAELEASIPEPTDAELERDAELAVDELLADMPELKAPTKLRLRERNRLTGLVLRSEAVASSLDENADSAVDREAQIAILDFMAGVDEFAESIAIDPNAYVEWAVGKDYPVFMAILKRYSVALGK